MKRLMLSMLCLGMVAMVGAGTASAQDPIVQVIHNSPNAPAVDIYLNGGESAAIEALDFRQATGLIALPAGMYEIGIAPAPSSGPGDIIATFGPYDLTDGSQTVIMAAGELGGDFGLFVNALNTMAADGQVGVLAFHGAPDAPTVDVAAVDVGPLFTSLDYLAFQGYLEVPAADYALTVAPAGDDPIAGFDAPLSGLGGGAAVVFASGYLGMAPEFGLYAALSDGTVIMLPPDNSVSTEVTSLSDLKEMYR